MKISLTKSNAIEGKSGTLELFIAKTCMVIVMFCSIASQHQAKGISSVNGAVSQGGQGSLPPSCITDQTVSASPTNVCIGASSTVNVAATDAGFIYSLYNQLGNVLVAGPTIATGAAINFNTGSISIASTFYVFGEKDKYSANITSGQGGFSIPDANSLDLTNNFTIEGWIKPNGASGFSRMFNKSQAYALGLSNGQSSITFTRHNVSDYSVAYAFTTGQWYHIACTYASGTVEFFVNGVSVGTVSSVASPAVTNLSAQIGSESNGFHFFEGNIDNVRLWSSVRTQADISANMYSFLTSTGNPTLNGSWWIIEGSGNAQDYSSYANNATAFVGTWATDVPYAACSMQLTQTATVSMDNIAPTITCPASITVNMDAGQCSKSVVTNNATTNDNCSVASLSWTMTGATTNASTGSGIQNVGTATFNNGVTTVTYIVTDASGNTASCSSTVTVADNLAPVVICPASTTVNVANLTLLANYPLLTDLVDKSANLANVQLLGNSGPPPTSPTAGNPLCQNGIYYGSAGGQIIFTPVINTLNISNFQLNIEFRLTTYNPTGIGYCPIIIGGTSYRWIGILVNSTGKIGVLWNNGNSSFSTTTLSLSQWYSTRLEFSNNTIKLFLNDVLVHTVAVVPLVHNGDLNFTATHFGSGGTLNGCIRNLVVYNSSPSIGCTYNGIGGNAYSTDNCSTVTTTGPVPSGPYAVGTTNLVWTGTDGSGNTSTCSNTITVVDNITPNITCPGSSTFNVDAGQCSKVVVTTDAITNDNCSVSHLSWAMTGATTGASVLTGINNVGTTTFNKGVTTVTYKVTDASGNTTSCSSTVTVIDNIAPTITCPANVTINTNAGLCTGNASIGTATASDNCTATVTGPVPAGPYSIGTTVVTWTATDASGNSTTCNQSVTVVDLQAPVISCPSSVTVNNTPGQCNALVNFVAPVVTDNCGGSVSGSQTFNYSGSIVNYTVPADVTQITIVAKGGQGGGVNGGLGASMTGLVNVTPGQILKVLVGQAGNGSPFGFSGGGGSFVTDNSNNPLVIAGGGGGRSIFGTDGNPGLTGTSGGDGSTALGGSAGNGGANGNFGGSGGCGLYGSGGGGLFTNGLLSGDGGGNAFINGGQGGTDPSGNCVTSATGGFGGGGAGGNGGGGGGGYSGGAGGDNTCCGPGANGNFPGGGGGGSYNAGSNQNNLAGNNAGDGVVTISYTVTYPILAQTTGLPSGSAFPVGTTLNTFVATDYAGNTSSCSFTVSVVDAEAPVITCPSNITVNVDAGQCSKSVVTTNAITNDNCSVSHLSWIMAGATTGTSPLTGINNVGTVTFNKGVTTITYIVTDASGNTTSCSSTVTVIDNIAPTISCPSSVTVNNTSGLCNAVVNFTTPAITDNCGDNISASQTFSYTGSIVNYTVPANVTQVTIVAKGAQGGGAIGGLGASMTGTVSVTPGQVLKVLVGQAGNGTNGGGPYGYSGGGGSFVTDNANNPLVIAGGGGGRSIFGTDGNPGLTGTSGGDGSTALGGSAGNGGANGNFGGSGGCAWYGSGGGGLLTNGLLSGDGGGFAFINGGAGGTDPSASCTVNPTGGFGGGGAGGNGGGGGGGYSGGAGGDNTCCGPGSNFNFPGGGGGGSYNAGSNQNNLAGDNSGDGEVTISYTVIYSTLVQTTGLPSGSAFPVGTTLNTFVATDQSGNTASCSFNITVVDAEAPTITCPANVTVTANNSGCTYNGSIGTASATDNCAVTVSHLPLAPYAIGTTAVTWKATDASGNSVSCIQMVTVVSAPIVIASNPKINVACKGSNTGSINTSVSGGTSPYSYLWNNGSTGQNANSLFAGTYTVMVTDANGCTKTASFTITQPATILTISISKTNVRCGGKATGEATASGTGGVSPYSYAWGNGSTADTRSNLLAGTYTVTVTDAAGCSKTKSVTITQNPAQTVIVTPLPSNQYYADNGGGVAPYAYYWNTSPAQTTQTATIITSGSNYKVKVTDSKGCTVISSTFAVGSKLAQSSTNDLGIAVMPNPSTGLVTLTVSNCINCDVLINMFDVIGQQVFSKEMKVENNTTLDFIGLATGIYTMRVMYDGRIEVVKIIIQ